MRAADEEVDRCSVMLELRNEAYNTLMAKHHALQQDHRASQRELRVREASFASGKRLHQPRRWCLAYPG